MYSEDTLLALSGLVPERYHDEVRGCVAPALRTDRGSEEYLSMKRDLDTAWPASSRRSPRSRSG